MVVLEEVEGPPFLSLLYAVSRAQPTGGNPD